MRCSAKKGKGKGRVLGIVLLTCELVNNWTMVQHTYIPPPQSATLGLQSTTQFPSREGLEAELTWAHHRLATCPRLLANGQQSNKYVLSVMYLWCKFVCYLILLFSLEWRRQQLCEWNTKRTGINSTTVFSTTLFLLLFIYGVILSTQCIV